MLVNGKDVVGGVVYERHRPEQTQLYQNVEAHYPALVDQLGLQGKSLPDHVHREFDAYLKCGRLEHGFLRVRCDTCHFERLERRGLLEQDAESAWLDLDPNDDTDAMPQILGSSVSYRVAVGPQQGRKAAQPPSSMPPWTRRPHPGTTAKARLQPVRVRFDLEVCGHCGGTVKVIVGAPNRCIEDQHVIDRILAHLRDKERNTPTLTHLFPRAWHLHQEHRPRHRLFSQEANRQQRREISKDDSAC